MTYNLLIAARLQKKEMFFVLSYIWLSLMLDGRKFFFFNNMNFEKTIPLQECCSIPDETIKAEKAHTLL